mgnify:FL=1
MKILPAAVISAWLLATSAPLLAEPKPGDLKDVQKAISAAQQQIRQTGNEQKAVDGKLAQTRSQLDAAQAELTRLNKQHSQAQQQLQQLQTRLEQLKTDIGGAQAQVARLLNAHYRNRQPNAVMLFLQQTEAADKGRHLQYMRYLNRANEQVIAKLHSQQQELAKQQSQVDQQFRQLAQLQQQQQRLLGSLGKKQQQQQQQSQALASQLNQQSQTLAELRDDEKRLNRLIQQLAVQAAAKRKAEAEARRLAAQKRAQALAAAQQAQATTPPAATANKSTPPTSTLTAEDLALQPPPDSGQDVHQPAGFSRLQGQMRRPVSGNIAGQFGQSRPEGGTWKGLFISTPPATVHSIAAGDVAYAAALQGYGNTVIVDHGDGYLSIYTGLSGIDVRAGSRVSARQSLGRSGRIPGGDNGLYFEIRYRNQAMNPLSWLS